MTPFQTASTPSAGPAEALAPAKLWQIWLMLLQQRQRCWFIPWQIVSRRAKARPAGDSRTQQQAPNQRQRGLTASGRGGRAECGLDREAAPAGLVGGPEEKTEVREPWPGRVRGSGQCQAFLCSVPSRKTHGCRRDEGHMHIKSLCYSNSLEPSAWVKIWGMNKRTIYLPT